MSYEFLEANLVLILLTGLKKSRKKGGKTSAWKSCMNKAFWRNIRSESFSISSFKKSGLECALTSEKQINLTAFFWRILRWLETVFHFPFQLNCMKGLLVCSKRLLLLFDSRCCNNLSTYQLLYSHWHFGCHGNLTGPQIRTISSIQLHFTQKVAGELPFLLHQNCLHIKDHFLRKFKKILSRGFGATLIFCNIKVAPKPLDIIFLNFLKKCSLICIQF